MTNWGLFFMQFQMDMKLWLCFMIFFFLFRIVFILSFRSRIEKTSSLSTVLAAIFNGARYDGVVCTIWIIVPFCFSAASGFMDSTALAAAARTYAGIAFMVASSIVCVITLSYFSEFGDQFNHFLFGLIYDDLKATLLTIIKAYNVLGHLLAIVAASVIGWRLSGAWIGTPFITPDTVQQYFSSIPIQALTTFFIVYLLAIGARGTLGFGPPLRERHAAITNDAFLNKTVMNPYKALWYAVERQMKLSGSDGIKVFLPDKDVSRAARFVFSSTEHHDDLDRYMLSKTHGPKGIPPRHIFYIVAESYSAWPMWDRYAPLHLADGLKGLAAEGISIAPFISGSQGTMGTLNTIVTNLPDAGISTNYRPTARTPYPTSIARIFKDLGYVTRFLYGGFLSWQRVGDFCRDQGFDEIYGGGHMGDWVSSNEWGVDDEHLFDFAKKTVNDDRPSFNLILTTSFHPPFTVDVKAKGFDLDAIPEGLREICDTDVDLAMWGHLWYADRCIADFSRWITNRLPQSLVVITADHAARKTVNKDPDIFERTSIPCVFYGPDVLKGINAPYTMAGSHLDIIPTLVELSAPEGFCYHTLGRDLLQVRPMPLGVGKNLVIGPSFFAETGSDTRIFKLPGAEPTEAGPDGMELKRLHDALHGIAWWRVMQGPRIAPASERPQGGGMPLRA